MNNPLFPNEESIVILIHALPNTDMSPSEYGYYAAWRVWMQNIAAILHSRVVDLPAMRKIMQRVYNVSLQFPPVTLPKDLLAPAVIVDRSNVDETPQAIDMQAVLFYLFQMFGEHGLDKEIRPADTREFSKVLLELAK
jgi:hypothetical protein